MRIAAAAKPTSNPWETDNAPVSTGPSRPPTLMPK